MNDQELAEYLNLTPADAAIVIPKLTPQRRATYDRMKQLELEFDLWLIGLGPKPDALIDSDRSTQRRRGWR